MKDAYIDHDGQIFASDNLSIRYGSVIAQK